MSWKKAFNTPAKEPTKAQTIAELFSTDVSRPQSYAQSSTGNASFQSPFVPPANTMNQQLPNYPPQIPDAVQSFVDNFQAAINANTAQYQAAASAYYGYDIAQQQHGAYYSAGYPTSMGTVPEMAFPHQSSLYGRSGAEASAGFPAFDQETSDVIAAGAQSLDKYNNYLANPNPVPKVTIIEATPPSQVPPVQVESMNAVNYNPRSRVASGYDFYASTQQAEPPPTPTAAPEFEKFNAMLSGIFNVNSQSLPYNSGPYSQFAGEGSYMPPRSSEQNFPPNSAAQKELLSQRELLSVLSQALGKQVDLGSAASGASKESEDFRKRAPVDSGPSQWPTEEETPVQTLLDISQPYQQASSLKAIGLLNLFYQKVNHDTDGDLRKISEKILDEFQLTNAGVFRYRQDIVDISDTAHVRVWIINFAGTQIKGVGKTTCDALLEAMFLVMDEIDRFSSVDWRRAVGNNFKNAGNAPDSGVSNSAQDRDQNSAHVNVSNIIDSLKKIQGCPAQSTQLTDSLKRVKDIFEGQQKTTAVAQLNPDEDFDNVFRSLTKRLELEDAKAKSKTADFAKPSNSDFENREKTGNLVSNLRRILEEQPATSKDENNISATSSSNLLADFGKLLNKKELNFCDLLNNSQREGPKAEQTEYFSDKRNSHDDKHKGKSSDRKSQRSRSTERKEKRRTRTPESKRRSSPAKTKKRDSPRREDRRRASKERDHRSTGRSKPSMPTKSKDRSQPDSKLVWNGPARSPPRIDRSGPKLPRGSQKHTYEQITSSDESTDEQNRPTDLLIRRRQQLEERLMKIYPEDSRIKRPQESSQSGHSSSKITVTLGSHSGEKRVHSNDYSRSANKFDVDSPDRKERDDFYDPSKPLYSPPPRYSPPACSEESASASSSMVPQFSLGSRGSFYSHSYSNSGSGKREPVKRRSRSRSPHRQPRTTNRSYSPAAPIRQENRLPRKSPILAPLRALTPEDRRPKSSGSRPRGPSYRSRSRSPRNSARRTLATEERLLIRARQETDYSHPLGARHPHLGRHSPHSNDRRRSMERSTEDARIVSDIGWYPPKPLPSLFDAPETMQHPPPSHDDFLKVKINPSERSRTVVYQDDRNPYSSSPEAVSDRYLSSPPRRTINNSTAGLQGKTSGDAYPSPKLVNDPFRRPAANSSSIDYSGKPITASGPSPEYPAAGRSKKKSVFLRLGNTIENPATTSVTSRSPPRPVPSSRSTNRDVSASQSTNFYQSDPIHVPIIDRSKARQFQSSVANAVIMIDYDYVQQQVQKFVSEFAQDFQLENMHDVRTKQRISILKVSGRPFEGHGSDRPTAIFTAVAAFVDAMKRGETWDGM